MNKVNHKDQGNKDLADPSRRLQPGPWLEPLSEAEQKRLQPLAPPDPDPEDSWQPPGLGLLRYTGLAKAVAGFALAFAGLQAALMVGAAASLHWSLGLAAGLVIGLPGLWAGSKIWQALRNGRRVAELAALRTEAALLAAGDAGGFSPWSQRTGQLLPALAGPLASLQERLGPYANDREKLAELDRLLAAGQDQQAHRALVRATRRSALGVAASPFLALDLLLVLAGNLSLVGQIARAYGLPPSPFLEARLLVQVYRQIAALGAIELGSELAGQTLTHSVVAKLSGRVAQGLAAGFYTYRIGAIAMGLCRPLAFSDQSEPKAGSLFRDLFRQLEAEDLS